jgi:hypothetical protein
MRIAAGQREHFDRSGREPCADRASALAARDSGG